MVWITTEMDKLMRRTFIVERIGTTGKVRQMKPLLWSLTAIKGEFL